MSVETLTQSHREHEEDFALKSTQRLMSDKRNMSNLIFLCVSARESFTVYKTT